MIRLHHVSKYYRSGERRIAAVRDANIEIPKGAVVLLTGKNGSGKSTLISLMCGIISPTSGRVYFDGKDISRLPERFLTRIRREQTGMIFQGGGVLNALTVMDNLVLPLVPTNLSSNEIHGKGKEVIERFGLKGKGTMKVSRLSGGEKQRLVIARALINNPEVIFADEPTTHLDEDVLQFLSAEMAEWKNNGKTIVIATHQTDILKKINVDVCIHIEKGQLAGKEI